MRELLPPRSTEPELDGLLELPLMRPSSARRMSLRGELPVPAQGGRSLWVMLVPRAFPPPKILALACGRLLELLPNPAGARPRSEELPCASQVRVLPGPPRCKLLDGELPPRMPELGLSSDSSRWRADIPKFWPLFAPPLNPPLFAERFACSKPRPLLPLLIEFGRPLPPRMELFSAARKVPELKERVGMWDAPAAGVLRATTERFWIATEGEAPRPALLAPK